LAQTDRPLEEQTDPPEHTEPVLLVEEQTAAEAEAEQTERVAAEEHTAAEQADHFESAVAHTELVVHHMPVEPTSRTWYRTNS